MRWRIVAMLGAAAVVALLIAIVPRRPAGPVYLGRTLDSWLSDLRSDRPASELLATDAVRRMGTNAVPFLVERLRQADPRREFRMRTLLREFGAARSPVKFSVSYPRLPREEALGALYALGEPATNAIPALEQLLSERPPDHRALLVLARMGRPAEAALTAALTNGEPLIRNGAEVSLHLMRTRSEILFPNAPRAYQFESAQCRFNLLMISPVFAQYKKFHPEGKLADEVDFTPPSSAPR
jgi:hypothetical protein